MKRTIRLFLFRFLIFTGLIILSSSVQAQLTYTIQGTCEKSISLFTPNLHGAAFTHMIWFFGDASAPVTRLSEDTITHSFLTPGLYHTKLEVHLSSGVIDSVSQDVLIQTQANFSIFTTSATCSNQAIRFNLNLLNGVIPCQYIWNFGDGSPVTIINAPLNPAVSHHFPVAGIQYFVTLTVRSKGTITSPDTCAASQTIIINNFPSPSASFNFAGNCPQSLTQFTDQSGLNGGTPLINWQWNFNDPVSGVFNTSTLRNATHTFANAGTYAVRLVVQNQNNCLDTLHRNVVMTPLEPVDFAWNGHCEKNTTTFTINPLIMHPANIQSYTWDFGDGTILSGPALTTTSHTYAAAGSYTVGLFVTDKNLCSSSNARILRIDGLPRAQFTWTNPCASSATQFTDNSTPPAGGSIFGWAWDFGVPVSTLDTSSTNNPRWAYANSGPYTAKLKVTTLAGCSDSIRSNLQIWKAHSNFTYTTRPCDNGEVFFTDSSYALPGSFIQAWKWEFEPNYFSSSQNPSYIYTALDSCRNVSLIATDNHNCSDTVFKQVCVPASYQFTFTASQVCLGLQTSFTPRLLSPVGDSLISFAWDFGDLSSPVNTSPLKFPLHRYALAGRYRVSLTATDLFGCVYSKDSIITVSAPPVANFAASVNSCDSTGTFTDRSSGVSSAITEWRWDFGDATSAIITPPLSPNGSHLYPGLGNFIVSLQVTNGSGCTSTFMDTLTINPCIQANFSVPVGLHCQDNQLTFTDNSTSSLPITNWNWDFGDGSPATSYAVRRPTVNHAYPAAGTYTITLTVTTMVASGPIISTSVQAIVIAPSPVANFTYSRTCLGKATAFTNTSSWPGSIISGYRWNFGDASATPPGSDTSQLKTPAWTYKTAGNHNVRLIATNVIGCSDTVTNPVIVHDLPHAEFSSTTACTNQPTKFTDLSDPALAPITKWQWTFIEGTSSLGSSNLQNPTYKFTKQASYFTDLLVADTNGCVDTVRHSIAASSAPAGAFTYKDNQGNQQGHVQFENATLGATKYFWDFGNGTSSFEASPVAIYTEDSTYTITLISYTTNNCTDTTRATYQFVLKGLYVPNAFSPNYPDDTIKIFKPAGINLKEYNIEIYDRWGKRIWWSEKLDSHGSPAEAWDGTLNGKECQQGVYVWKIKAIFKDNTIWTNNDLGEHANLPQTTFGNILLIR